MNDNNGDAPVVTQYEEAGEISIVDLVNTLLRYRKLLVFLPLLLAFVVGGSKLVSDRKYSATGAFQPQMPKSVPSGALSLARQFGVNIGNDQSAFSPDFYAELIQTSSFLRKVVESEYDVEQDGERRRMTLIDHLEAAEKPGVLAPWQKAVESLREDFGVGVGLETGVVKFGVRSIDPLLAEQIASRVLVLLADFNQTIRQSQAREELKFVEGRMKEARNEVLDVEDKLKRFLQRNRNFQNSPELMFEHDRLQREVTLRQELYTSMLQSYEQARVDVVRDTPMLTIISDPRDSAEPLGRGTVRMTILAFMLGLMLSVVLAFVLDFVKRARRREQDKYQEFDRLRADVLKDIRNPVRIFRRKKVAAGDL